ncbi:hypothetical protein BDR26DRAFT_931896 [Obelidium mucronatum]|nr:hypothetical protein BDR26DRAFT_931896 [Obelidium mucronatum]
MEDEELGECLFVWLREQRKSNQHGTVISACYTIVDDDATDAPFPGVAGANSRLAHEFNHASTENCHVGESQGTVASHGVAGMGVAGMGRGAAVASGGRGGCVASAAGCGGGVASMGRGGGHGGVTRNSRGGGISGAMGQQSSPAVSDGDQSLSGRGSYVGQDRRGVSLRQVERQEDANESCEEELATHGEAVDNNGEDAAIMRERDKQTGYLLVSHKQTNVINKEGDVDMILECDVIGGIGIACYADLILEGKQEPCKEISIIEQLYLKFKLGIAIAKLLPVPSILGKLVSVPTTVSTSIQPVPKGEARLGLRSSETLASNQNPTVKKFNPRYCTINQQHLQMVQWKVRLEPELG